MNNYPFEVAGLLPPPPPPPPPLPSLLPIAQVPTPLYGQECANSQTYTIQNPKSLGNAQGLDHYLEIKRTMHQEMSQSLSNNLVDSLMMLPHDQLRLPPPPPPPPPLLPPPPPPPPVQLRSSVTQNLMGNSSNFPTQRDMYSLRAHNNPASMPKHTYSSAPPVWATSKHTPSGLQGPWKSSDSSEFDSRTDEMTEENSIKHVLISSTFARAGDTCNSTSLLNSSDPPMTPAATVYKDHKVNPKEPGLPRELTNLFEALHCKLCEVLSSSTVQAKLHYSGKPHEKKVRQWLMNWSEETGLPIPKRPKMDVKASVNPEDLFCQLCDITFSSVKHGEQHKMGKAHQKALRQGYSSVKRKSKKVDVPVDPSGRFGIGEAFCKDKVCDLELPLPPSVSDIPVSSPILGTGNKSALSKYTCDLCKISATSQEHLDAHYAGAKHRKALANAAKNCTPCPEPSVIPPAVEPSESILASVINHNDPNLLKTRGAFNDLSIYRTPSGQFYCHPCNTTTNSEKTFREHTESKRHKYKVASSKRS